MNKIFKVVWSKVRNAYVVVSEIAKNTVSGVGKRNRIGKVSLAATLAASVLTGGFFMPNEVWAAVSALVDSKPVYYIAIGNAKTNVNPFGSNSDIVYDRTSGQRYINVVDGGETYKYIYIRQLALGDRLNTIGFEKALVLRLLLKDIIRKPQMLN